VLRCDVSCTSHLAVAPSYLSCAAACMASGSPRNTDGHWTSISMIYTCNLQSGMINCSLQRNLIFRDFSLINGRACLRLLIYCIVFTAGGKLREVAVVCVNINVICGNIDALGNVQEKDLQQLVSSCPCHLPLAWRYCYYSQTGGHWHCPDG